MVDREALEKACDAYYDYSSYNIEGIEAAIAAYLSATQAKGWKMVPREVSQPQLSAIIYRAVDEDGDGLLGRHSFYTKEGQADRLASAIIAAMFDAHTPDTQERE